MSKGHSSSTKDKGPIPTWKSVLSLEPALVIHMTSAIMVFMVVQDFLLEKACRVNLSYGDKVCDALQSKSSSSHAYREEEKEVQKLVGGAMVYRTFLENAFPIVLVLLIGAWSDKYGRKAPILVVVSAFILQDILLMGCVFFGNLAGVWTVVIVSSVVVSLAGNQACFMVCAFSYVSDTTPLEKRTMRTTITHCCIFLGITIGLGMAGVLSHSGFSFTQSFLLGMGMELFALLYLSVMMTNRGQPGAAKGKSWASILWELFDFKHVKDAAHSILKKREGKARTKLWLLLLAHACCFTPMLGEMGVMYLFSRLQFQWDGASFGSFMTYKTVIGFLANFASMAILTKLFALSDPVNGIVACVGNLLSSLIFTFAKTPVLMYIAPLFTILSGGTMVIPRSTISKIIPTEELGKINSFIGSLESIIPLVASALYTQVYARFLDTLPGSFFLISAALAIPPILIYWGFLTEEKVDKRKKRR